MKMLTKIQLLVLQALVISPLFAFSTNTVAGSDPYIGEVRWFAGNFAPRGWAFCDGQTLLISQNSALFSLLGTTYGGDGRTTFNLPDMRGRAMMHTGQGPGLSSRPIGGKSGVEDVTLVGSQLPPHNHQLKANTTGANSVLPDDRVLSSAGRLRIYSDASSNLSDMGASSIDPAGGSQGHNNVPPYVTANCIIALQGIFPSRN